MSRKITLKDRVQIVKFQIKLRNAFVKATNAELEIARIELFRELNRRSKNGNNNTIDK